MIIYRIITIVLSLYLVYKLFSTSVCVYLADKHRKENKDNKDKALYEMTVYIFKYKQMEWITTTSFYNMLLMFIEVYFINK